MKKIILPIAAVALMTACSDVNELANFAAAQGGASSSSVATTPVANSSSDATVGASSSDAVLPTDLSSSSVAVQVLDDFRREIRHPQGHRQVPAHGHHRRTAEVPEDVKCTRQQPATLARSSMEMGSLKCFST